MPFSLRENNTDYVDFVRQHDIKTILDVGPGFGTYARILRDHGLRDTIRIDAVEIYEPYVERFRLKEVYDDVVVMDVRNCAIAYGASQYDLIIFGDVLEHMTHTQALMVWNWASTMAKYGMISVPIVHWPQEGTENPWEAHLQDHLHTDDILLDYGPFETWHEYESTATFFKQF